MLEVSGQACINSQVLPFCDWWEPVAHVTGSIGHGMRAAGIISSPDVMMKSEHRPALGHPPRSHAYSRILTPGDREPKLAVFEKQLKSCLADAETLRENPSISMAMHSWHSEEGLKTLDLIFERLARRPDWWYCNQTEYGAYRYEALNCSVRKETQDCAAIFSITRMTPAELGADVPLWFTVSAATPLKAAGGRLHGTLLEVPHDSRREVPRKIGRMMKNGTSSEFPELSLTLASLGAGKWRAVIKNQGRSDLRECEFTFRFPAVWEKAAMRADLPAVKAGSSASVTVVQPSRRPELYFQYGAPYAALQLDFRRNGKQNRLYAEWEEPAPEKLPLPPDDAALICEMPPNADPAGISRPDTVLAKSGLTASRHIRKRKNAGPYSIHPVIDNRKWPRDTAVLAILDFETDSASPLQFRSRSLEAWLKCEIWFNGKKIATSYPVILRKYLEGRGIKADIHMITGSVEISPGIGLADGIFDIVSSGSTLVSNNLREVEVVMESEAVLIANKALDTEKRNILDRLLFRIKAVRNAEDKKYVRMNVPKSCLDEIINVLPGLKSPTIIPLADNEWCSVHTVLDESRFWEIIGKLKELGAQGILVTPIEKMIL